MQCEEVRRNIPDYLTGTLAAPLESSVQEHLEGCPQCREEFDALNTLWASLDLIPVPARERSDTRAALLTTLERRTKVRQIVKAATLILVVAMVAAAAGMFLMRHPAVETNRVGVHVRGAAQAPVTLVEYGDY